MVSGETTNQEMKKLEPFIGTWNTLSVYPDSGLEIPGKLTNRWALGKNWMLLEFDGKHPKRPFWAAVVMYTYDAAKKRYIAHSFYSADGPIIFEGHWLSPTTISYSRTTEKSTSGIDYTIKPDGTIYQENWSTPTGQKRKITLKTTYTRAK